MGACWRRFGALPQSKVKDDDSRSMSALMYTQTLCRIRLSFRNAGSMTYTFVNLPLSIRHLTLGFPHFQRRRTTAMQRLTYLAAIGVIGLGSIGSAMAQTPTGKANSRASAAPAPAVTSLKSNL